MEQAKLAASTAFEQLTSQERVGLASAEAAKYGANLTAKTGTQSAQLGALGALGAAFIASDKRLKKKIKPGGDKMKAFLDALNVHDYEYKDKKHGKGRQVSVMAQELEKSDIGKQFVVETKIGKMVDYGKGFAAILASQAHLNKRLNALESDG